MKHSLVKIKNNFRAPLYKLLNQRKHKYQCTICGYRGPFIDKLSKKSVRSRLNAKCPSCSSMERHRFQYFLLEQVLSDRDRATLSLLHFAPEPSLENVFREQFLRYVTADLLRDTVDYKFDVQQIPFDDRTFDVILNSHVLQYVPDDLKALSELARVLKPGGVALLPVPLLHEQTIEKQQLDPELQMPHEPGVDYFDRYQPFFDKVDLHYSSQYSDDYHFFRQLTSDHPFPLKLGEGRYGDIIPICYKN